MKNPAGRIKLRVCALQTMPLVPKGGRPETDEFEKVPYRLEAELERLAGPAGGAEDNIGSSAA
jgi:hypothetical protein